MIQAICWMLIHSLWQGLLLTILTGIVLVYTKKAAATVRYNLLSGLYFLFLAGCALTLILEWYSSGNGEVSGQSPAAFSESRLSSFIATLNDYLSDHASLIVMGWCFIFLFKCVRITASIVYTQRIRNYGVSQPPLYWKDKVQSFCAALQIKRTVQLLESRLVKMPLVTGHWKPVIFIPLGLLTNLPEGEIEAVLLHELAHIRRNDYFMNFGQHIGESIFFFNPGLLWISSLLREERENCCDDMAIDRTRNKQEFVRALIHFREHNLRLAGVALTFPAGKNQLLHRVMRIVENKNKSLNKAERIFFLASFFIISLLLVAATHQVLRPVDAPYKVVAEETTNTDPSLLIKALPPIGHTIQPFKSVPPGGLAFDNGVYTGPFTASVHPDLSIFLAKSRQDEEQTIQSSADEEHLEEVQTIEEDEQNKAQADEKQAQAIEGDRQIIQDQQQAIQDRQQAMQDRQQADRDRVQMEKDRVQAKLDREQADQDRRQAEEGRKQAQLDKSQAAKMQELERLEKIQAEKGDLLKKETPAQMAKAVVEAVILRKQAEQDKVQAEKEKRRITTVIAIRASENLSIEQRIVQVTTKH